MTDPSKRYWITEQGMKEAAKEIFPAPWDYIDNFQARKRTAERRKEISQSILAHSEAASPPTPDQLLELLRDANANMESLLVTVRPGEVLRSRTHETLQVWLVESKRKLRSFEAAAPPQGTPAPELKSE